MAGHADESQYKFTGWQKNFNTYTKKGRFNIVASTVGFSFLTYMWLTRGSKSKSIAAPASTGSHH